MARPELDRRTVLGVGAAGLAGLAGWTTAVAGGSGESDDGGGETTGLAGTDAGGDPDLSRVNTESGRVRIERGERSVRGCPRAVVPLESKHFSVAFTDSGYVYCDFSVRNGAEIDVIFMEEEEYVSAFDSEEGFEYDADLSAFGSAGDTVEGAVEAGSYVWVLNNASLGNVAPGTGSADGPVTVEYEMKVGE